MLAAIVWSNLSQQTPMTHLRVEATWFQTVYFQIWWLDPSWIHLRASWFPFFFILGWKKIISRVCFYLVIHCDEFGLACHVCVTVKSREFCRAGKLVSVKGAKCRVFSCPPVMFLKRLFLALILKRQNHWNSLLWKIFLA